MRGFWATLIFRMTEGASVITQSPNGGSLNVTRPYKLGGRLFGTLKSNILVSMALGMVRLLLCQLTSVTGF